MWPVILIGLVACFVMASSLDVLALGERAAQHSGVNVERLRAVSIAATALLTVPRWRMQALLRLLV